MQFNSNFNEKQISTNSPQAPHQKLLKNNIKKHHTKNYKTNQKSSKEIKTRVLTTALTTDLCYNGGSNAANHAKR